MTVAAMALAGAGQATAASSRTVLRHSASPIAARTPRTGSVSRSSEVGFQVDLKLRNAAGAAALANAVSNPKSSQYGHFLTAKQWEARFSPSARSVAKVRSFLRQAGFAVGQTSKDRMEVSATGTASRIESVFQTTLSMHNVQGHVVRLAATNLSVPARLGGIVNGVTGVNETLETTDHQTDRKGTSTPATTGPFPPPAGYRSAPQCSSYFGETPGGPLDPDLGPYPGPGGSADPSSSPWAVCGYVGSQLRGAYGIDPNATNGTGVTVAIVDAYADPHLGYDLSTYISGNSSRPGTDPSYPLTSGQFSELLPKSYTIQHACTNNSWYGEQNLDVESVHNMAPGANILYVGAQSCSNNDLNNALREVVDGKLAQVVSDSWGSLGGDVTESATDRQATDQILEMAAGEGISVLFSSGDDGDDYPYIDQVAANYPASSPWATAVGGTSLAIGQDKTRIGDWGWSTARSWLCNATYVALGGCSKNQEGTWLPIDLSLDGGSGGGTSASYLQPPYQKGGVVPTNLATAAGSGQPMRVEPDVSMDADPATGELIGEWQTFPDGSYYDTYRLGGTSLASPLFAGLLADTIQSDGGHPFGLVNYELYQLAGNSSASGDDTAFDDIRPVTPLDSLIQFRGDYANSIDSSDGYLFSARTIDYEGSEQYCPAKGHKNGPKSVCTDQPVSLHTASGYDNMTGLGSAGTALVGDLAAIAPTP